MTRFPHDQFAKDFLESLLSPLGQVQTSLKISGEVREVDVYFVPDPIKVILEARETIEPEEQELIMQLSPLYLEKLQEAQQVGEHLGEQRGEVRHAQAQTVRLLNRRVGDVSAEILAKVKVLPLERLDDLHDAALDFTKISDLTDWLDLNG
jgi:hypothetical protein